MQQEKYTLIINNDANKLTSILQIKIVHEAACQEINQFIEDVRNFNASSQNIRGEARLCSWDDAKIHASIGTEDERSFRVLRDLEFARLSSQELCGKTCS